MESTETGQNQVWTSKKRGEKVVLHHKFILNERLSVTRNIYSFISIWLNSLESADDVGEHAGNVASYPQPYRGK